MKSHEKIGIGLLAIGFIFLPLLLYANIINLNSYTILLPIILICSVTYWILPSLKELNLKELKLILQKIDKGKQELYAKEEDLKNVLNGFIELLFINNQWIGRFSEEESDNLRKEWTHLIVEKMNQEIEIDPKILDFINRYETIFKKIDENSKNQQIVDNLFEEEKSLLQSEIDRLKATKIGRV